MSSHEIGTVVFALKNLDDPPSGDSPGCRLCRFGDTLVVRDVREFKGRVYYQVSHEGVAHSRTFGVYGNEISTMKPFKHNDPHYPWRTP